MPNLYDDNRVLKSSSPPHPEFGIPRIYFTTEKLQGRRYTMITQLLDGGGGDGGYYRSSRRMGGG